MHKLVLAHFVNDARSRRLGAGEHDRVAARRLELSAHVTNFFLGSGELLRPALKVRVAHKQRRRVAVREVDCMRLAPRVYAVLQRHHRRRGGRIEDDVAFDQVRPLRVAQRRKRQIA
eukprot:6203181-Pleurochrysis_carterae.AAC.7